MKILIATMSLDIGGAETHIVELARELIRRGHQVLVASNGGVYVEELEAAGARHFKVPMHRRDPVLMAKSLLLLRKIIRAEKPDVVHAHARIPAFLCGIIKKTTDFPFVTTAHWVFETGFMLSRLTDWGERTIAVSDDIRDYLMDNYGIPSENITVTINGIDTDKFSPDVPGDAVRAEFNIPEGAPVLSHVSRLDESRALAASALVKLAPALAGRVPGVRILIAGGGDMFEELSHRAEEANLKLGYRCLIFAGPRTDVNAVCAAGDAFVGVSRAALEAMATGRPVVVAGNEGYMGLFDEDKLETGIQGNFCCRGCPELSEHRLLDDLTTALTLEPDEYRRLSQLGRRVVLENYSVKRMAQDALDVYALVRRHRQVVLSGYYGFNNAGDEAILDALCGALTDIDKNIGITVLSRDPKMTGELHGVKAVNRFSPFGVLKAVKGCELLISGGGSLLQDNTSTRSLLYYLSIVWTAHKMGKKTMLYANGIGPVNKPANRRRVRKIVELADKVTLRDPDSLRELRDMGVVREDLVEGADPVFTLPEPSHARSQEILSVLGIMGPFVTVSVRPIKNAPDYTQRFAQLCDGIYQRFGLGIVFLSMQPKRDEPVAWEIRDRMKCPAYVLSGEFSPTELMGIIGEGRLALSMRLHSLIFAARTATPALGFAYDPKVESYLSMLRLPSAGDGSDIDVEAVLKAVDVMLQNRDRMAESLRESRERITALARRNNEELRELLPPDPEDAPSTPAPPEDFPIGQRLNENAAADFVAAFGFDLADTTDPETETDGISDFVKPPAEPEIDDTIRKDEKNEA